MSLFGRIEKNDSRLNLCPLLLAMLHPKETKVEHLDCKEGTCAIYNKELIKCSILSMSDSFQGIADRLESIEKSIKKSAKAAKEEQSG